MTGRHKGAIRHFDVLEAMKKFVKKNGYPPSTRDLMDMTGVTSTSVMLYYVNILREEGLIRKKPYISRGIEIVPENEIEKEKANMRRKKFVSKKVYRWLDDPYGQPVMAKEVA